MKKSKVLIPAMALLLFSTAASITGTVAWFTSTRTFETTVGNFTVREVDGNLECTLGADVGTSVTSNVVSVNANTYLIDASLNVANAGTSIDMYRLIRDGSASEYFKKYNKGETGTDDWKYITIESDKYYLAVSWTMTFTYTFNSETAPLDVMLDLKGTEINGAASLGANETQDTALGFRIAFIAGSTVKVFGNRALGESGHEYDNMQYVNGITNTSVANLSGSNYLLHNASYDKTISALADGANHTTRPEYLGTISDAGAGTGNLVVTCVAWYEGTDPAVISDIDSTHKTKLQTLSADLAFFGRAAYVAP